MSADRSPTWYAGLSLATALATVSLKFAAWYLTGSVGLLSDALESVVNVVAAVVALATLTYASAAPDREHNFGHDKAQYLSSGIEGALIFIAAGGIVWSAVPRLFHPVALAQLGIGLPLAIAAAVANAACGAMLLAGARAHRSITLEADAKHLFADVWTTAGVVLGVGLVLVTGWLALDAVVALAVAVQILWTGWHLMGRSFEGLMDRALPPDDCAKIADVLASVRDVGCDYHALRTRMAGPRSFVDVHVLVPGNTPVQQAHDLAESLEQRIRERVPHAEVMVHLEPLEDPRSWNDHDDAATSA